MKKVKILKIKRIKNDDNITKFTVHRFKCKIH